MPKRVPDFPSDFKLPASERETQPYHIQLITPMFGGGRRSPAARRQGGAGKEAQGGSRMKEETGRHGQRRLRSRSEFELLQEPDNANRVAGGINHHGIDHLGGEVVDKEGRSDGGHPWLLRTD